MWNGEMEMRTWTVVTFSSDNTVEAVPTSWILSNKCYWPTISRDRIVPLIKKNDLPNTCWPLLDITMFRNSTYDNYLTARSKARKAEFTSDLNSDVEEVQKRKIIRKKKYSCSESEQSSESDSNEHHVRTPPCLNKASDAKVKQLTKNNVNESNSQVLDNDLPPKDLFSKIKANTRPDAKLLDTSRKAAPLEEQTSVMCTCCVKHKDEAKEYYKQIMRKQNILQGMISQLSEDLLSLKNLKNNDVDNAIANTVFLKFNFPLQNDQELEQFEEYLSNKNNFDEAVDEISRMGGSSPYDFMKRSLSRMLTNQLASEFSWLGAKKKKIFGKLGLSQLLIRSGLKCQKDATSKDLENAGKNWLRRAKERADLELKKVQKVNSHNDEK